MHLHCLHIIRSSPIMNCPLQFAQASPEVSSTLFLASGDEVRRLLHPPLPLHLPLPGRSLPQSHSGSDSDASELLFLRAISASSIERLLLSSSSSILLLPPLSSAGLPLPASTSISGVLFLHSPFPLQRTVCNLPQSHSSGSQEEHVQVAFLSRVSSIVFLLVSEQDVA